MSDRAKLGILLTAYGSPHGVAEVLPYLEHIRKGRPVGDALLKEITQRYESVGGQTPLLQITLEQARLLEELIKVEYGARSPKVYVGMKHWNPFIDGAIAEMIKDGVQDFIVVPLAQHFSKISIGGYEDAVQTALKAQNSFATFTMVHSWHDNTFLIDCISSQLAETLKQKRLDSTSSILFTAHSLPERIRTWNDPYEDELKKTSELVAKKLHLKNWQFAFQSAGQTGEPWLGPDIVDAVLKCGADGAKEVVVCPIGFVSDHLEILYDLDVECKGVAKSHRIEMIRVPSRNTSPLFIRSLFDVVKPWLPKN